MKRLVARVRDALRWPSRLNEVITAGLLLTAAVVFAQTASQLIDFRFSDLRLAVLDSDHHASVFGAMSLLAQAVAAAAIGLRAVSARRLAWPLVAVPIGVLTIPRGLMRYIPAFEQYDVLILVAPLTVVFVVLCALTFRDARRVRSIVWASLVLLACSFALHAVGPQDDADASKTYMGSKAYLATYTWTYQVTGMLKHGAELAGWMLLATGMAAGCVASQGARHAHRQRYRGAAPNQPADRSQTTVCAAHGARAASGEDLVCVPGLGPDGQTRLLRFSAP